MLVKLGIFPKDPGCKRKIFETTNQKSSYLSNANISHFHDCGRKSIFNRHEKNLICHMSPPQKPFPCPQKKKKKNIEANNLEHLHPIFKIMFSFITIFPLASLGKIQPRGTNKKKHGETFPWENKFRASNFTSPKPQLPAESLLPLLARRAPQNSWVTMAALVTFRSANSLR